MTHTISEIELRYKPNRLTNGENGENGETIKINSSKDSSRLLRTTWNTETIEYYEELKVIYLDTSNQVLGILPMSKGGLNATIADVRMIYQGALKANAQGIIVSHNHPSGRLEPSETDKQLTKKLKAAGDLLDIKLLDHIIITKESYMSFLDNNLM